MQKLQHGLPPPHNLSIRSSCLMLRDVCLECCEANTLTPKTTRAKYDRHWLNQFYIYQVHFRESESRLLRASVSLEREEFFYATTEKKQYKEENPRCFFFNLHYKKLKDCYRKVAISQRFNTCS